MTGRARGGQTTARGTAPAKKTTPKVDPDFVVVDLNDFAASELESVEELSGLPISRSVDFEKPQGAITRAMGWVVKVRTDPDFPYEDPDCDRGKRPRCGDCHCSRRLKVAFRVSELPVPPSGENA